MDSKLSSWQNRKILENPCRLNSYAFCENYSVLVPNFNEIATIFLFKISSISYFVRSIEMDSNHVKFVFCKEDDKKSLNLPMVVNKPSNFSIDHILNKAGTESKSIELKNRSFDDTNDSYLVNEFNGYPPILDWLQYTRYRPPRIPRKSIFANISRFEQFLKKIVSFSPLESPGPARNGPIKRTPGRLPRIPFTPFQLNELEAAYAQTNYLSSEDANKLATRLDLTCIRVKIWFQNRRARERREKREIETKTSPTQLSSHFQVCAPTSGI